MSQDTTQGCPHSKTAVLGTVRQEDGSIRRRRRCVACRYGYNTLELPQSRVEVLERSHAVVVGAMTGALTGATP